MPLKGCTDVLCSNLYDFCGAACKEPADHNKFHNELKNKRVKAPFYEASAIKVIAPRFVYAQQLKEAQLECTNRSAESLWLRLRKKKQEKNLISV